MFNPFAGKGVFFASHYSRELFGLYLKNFLKISSFFLQPDIKKGKKITPPWAVSATKWILIYDYIFIVFFADLMYSRKRK